MKKRFLPIIVLLSLISPTHFTFGQIERINQTIDSIEAESHLRFLTADEFKGRNTGSSELLLAGRYIAEQFRRYGLMPLGDVEGDYLQRVPLHSSRPATESTLSMFGDTFKAGEELLVLRGSNGVLNAPLVFLADLNDYESVDIEGKIIMTVLRDARSSARGGDNLKVLQEAGALGLVQLFGPNQRIPWKLILNYLNRERMQVGDINPEGEKEFPHIWVRDSEDIFAQKLKDNVGASVSIKIEGMQKKMVNAFNIVGKIEGTDPELKQEHIVMCAHYDHVGVDASKGQDSIFNGTRDNGIGTTGLINAAKYFGNYPPKRSIIIIALTGEEKGLLGSAFYAKNPKIPLNETVFAFNIDNSGYTTTDVITLLDTNRTNIDPLVYQAASEVGLGVIGDRLPKQNYYERSDQVSFAVAGVPAVNFKMSMVAFDERITKYYHQPADEFHTVDLTYIHKYWKAYIRSAELLGNWEKKPYWIKGDKFEPAGNKLYGIQD